MSEDVASKEYPVVFPCGSDKLLGILHAPVHAIDTGVLLVVGGPQYRVGSHRQYVAIARDLAQAGIPVFRFDSRGMGDSEGQSRGFDEIVDIDEDLNAAIDAFLCHSPQLRQVVLWGLCGSCCANLFYGHRDTRVAGMVLVNPWVRSPAGIARARLWHYYPRRMLDPSFWRNIAGGHSGIVTSAASLLGTMSTSLMSAQMETPLVDRMLDGLTRFSGPMLFILSGNDLTAHEFSQLTTRSRTWHRAMASPRIRCHTLPGADHTFSSRASRTTAAELVRGWMHTTFRG